MDTSSDIVILTEVALNFTKDMGGDVCGQRYK